jgi:hypothetical protein
MPDSAASGGIHTASDQGPVSLDEEAIGGQVLWMVVRDPVIDELLKLGM